MRTNKIRMVANGSVKLARKIFLHRLIFNWIFFFLIMDSMFTSHWFTFLFLLALAHRCCLTNLISVFRRRFCVRVWILFDLRHAFIDAITTYCRSFLAFLFVILFVLVSVFSSSTLFFRCSFFFCFYFYTVVILDVFSCCSLRIFA